MEISTNYTQTTSQPTQATQTEDNSTNRSFDNYMNTNTQEDTQKANSSSKEDYIEVSETEQTQTLTYTQDVAKVQEESYDPYKDFIKYLDQNFPDYFEKNGVSKEDEEIIREVVADNEISEHEAKQLSFEQAKALHKMEFSKAEYGPSDILFLPKQNNFTSSIIGTAGYSKDETLNKAIHKTLVENYTSETYENKYILGTLTDTLKQAYAGMDIGFNFHQAPTPFGLLHEFENSQIDYENHLLEVLNHVDTMLGKVSDPQTREHLADLNKGFGIILDNYRKIQDKEV